jgi:FAD/FMN-containing dehydrogenase
VQYAAAHGLRVAVQCTGHGAAAGIDESVLLVSTARLDAVEVQPDGTARAGAGARWQQVVDASVPHGYAPLNGSSLDVGVVGYITGGGLGPLARTFGFASDRVTAFDVVTADGTLRRATPSEEPELFWGLRGGKGSLGIVTAVEFGLVPVVSIYGGGAWFDGSDAAAVLETWRTWSAGLPEEATTSVALMQLPPLPGVPEPLAGRLTVAIRYAFTGDAAEGEALFAPVRAALTPVLDGVGVLPYAAIDAVHADPVDPLPFHERAALLADLPSQAVDALMRSAGPDSGSSLVMVEIRQLGGAVARPGQLPSAVSHRAAAYTLLCLGIAAPPVAANTAADCARVIDAAQPWATGGLLPNFGGGGVSAYDAETLTRLRGLIAAYDPSGLLVAADPLR